MLNTDSSIAACWEAPDPPWSGQGFDGEATEDDIPHPFIDKASEQKVILVNPSISLMNELKNKRKQFKKGYLEFIHEGNYVIADKLEKARGIMTEKLIAKGIEFRRLAVGRKIISKEN